MPQNQQNPYGFDYDPDWRNRDATEETERGFVDPQVVPPTTRPAEDFAGTYGFDYQPNWRNPPVVEEDLADIDPTWGDYGRIVMAGGAQIGSGIGWLLDKFHIPGGETLQEAGASAAEWWMEDLSPQAQAALQTEFTKRDRGQLWTDAKWNKAKLTAAQSLLGTAGGMGLGSLFTKGLAKAGMTRTITTAAGATATIPSRTAGAIGYGLGEAGVAAPSVGAEVEQQILAMPHDQLYPNSLEYQLTYDALEGRPEDRERRAKELLAEAAAGDAFALSLVSTFILSAPAGNFMARITKGMPLTEGGGRIAGGLRGGATEAAQEFGQSGAEAIATNIGLRQADPSRGLYEDVLEQAVGGALAGGLMGAGPGVAAKPGMADTGLPDPNDSPLAALDQAEPTGSTPIPETDIDMRTGKVITRTGDEEYDALDRALEQASVDLEMTLETDRLAKQVAREGAQRAAEIQGSRNMQMIEMEQQRDQQLAKQGRLEEARKAAQEEAMWQEQATAGIEDVGAAESEMVTPKGVPVEGEPIDVAGGQPATEGALRPEGIVPPGGRPFGTSLRDKLIEAGVRPPEKPQEPPAGEPGPRRGPDVTAREAAASEALMREEEQRALDEEAEAGYPDIPFTDEEIAARRPPDDEGPPGGQPPPPASTAVLKPPPEPEITEAVARVQGTSPEVQAANQKEKAAKKAYEDADERWQAALYDEPVASVEVQEQLEQEVIAAQEAWDAAKEATQKAFEAARARRKAERETTPAAPEKPNVPKPTKRPNYARDNFLTTRAKETVDKRLSMEKFEAEGLDIADMREKVYGGKPAFSRHPNAMGPDDVAEFLNENDYPNPFDNGSTGTWDANMALEAIRDEMAGVSEILTGEAIGNRAEEARYEEDLMEFQRQEEEAAPAGGEQLDMMPEATGRDAQVTRDQQQREREAAAPEADMGVAGDLFTGTSAESRQAAEMEAAQTDIEEAAAPEFDITTPEGRMASAKAAVAEAEKAFADATPEERMMFDSPVSKALEEARTHLQTVQAQQEAAPEETQGERWEREEFEARQAQLRDTGETRREPEEIIAEIEANIPTMKGVYGDTFGDMGRPKLVTAFRQLEKRIGETEDFDAVLDKVLDKLTYKPTRDAFIGAINASPETNLLVADIERQHESWRQEVIETDWMKLDTDEINRNNARIDELAEMGDPRAIELAKEADHWMNKDRIQAKSSHPRFKQSRKSNKYGGITDIRGRDSISLDAAQLSATVDYDSLTFQSPEDQARADRILEVIDKVAGQIEPTPKATPGGTPSQEAENATHVDAEGNVTFTIDEQQFNEVIDEWSHIAETPPKSKRQAIDVKLKNSPFIPLEEAQKKIDEWAAHAAKQREQPTYRKDVEGYDKDDYGFNPMDNSQRIVISLFDYTGQWARPWAEAGYDVYTFDIKSGQDAMDFSIEWFANEYNFDKEIYAILAAPPCTTFSNSGTRWRKTRHDAKSKEMVEEMWGAKAVEQGFEVPNEYGKELVAQTMRVIEYFRPKVWALENPEGRIESQAKLNDWRTGFQPSNFGDPYTKRTLLWGKFNEDMPTANVEPTEGSKMHKMSPSDERAAMRSETPEGFSYAFFMANNYNDKPIEERLPLEFNENAGAISEALRAGMTEPEIRNLVEDAYLNEDYEVVDSLIREAIAPPTPPPSRPAGIGYQLETEIMSKSVQELAKRDKIDLQAISLRLGIDDTGNKVELARRIKDFVASTPAAREAQLQAKPEPAPEPAAPKRFEISGSVMSATRDGLMPGITRARMDRIAENFAKVGDQLLANVTTSDRKFIKPDPFTEISFSEYDDYIRINSVNLSGLGTANTTRPDVYDSRRPTHIKKAIVALDQKLQSLVKYQDETPTALDIARAEADTNVEPTEAQKEAGNYKKGRVPLPLGMEFHIETPEGEVRYGNQKLKDPYGGFTGTKGMDGDPVDGFLNKKIEDDWRGDVYIVDQVNPETKKFDEHKVMFGYNNAMDARRAYKRNYQKDWTGTGNVTIMPIETFKKWLDTPGATKKPAAEFGTTDAAKKAREKSGKDNLYASGKDMLNAPSIEFVKKVLEGGERKMGDIVDTMPLNMAVEELLRIREQPAGFQAPEAPAYMPDSEEIEAAIKPLEDRMPGAPVRLLFDYRQAPEIVQRGMEADGMTHVPAVYSPVTNEIYLFTTRIDSTEHAIQLALHEKTHQGLREAFGAELDTILEDVYENASPQDVAYMMDLSGRYNKNMNILEDQLVLAEELIAYKAETDPQNNIVQRVVAFIRKWLRKAGLRLEYSDADITAIIAEAQNAIARRDSYENVMFTEDVEVAETGEIYEVETPAKDAVDAVDKRIEMCKKVKNCL